ncbi:DUF2628 domain-containing protein [Labrys wisconsinensis]|uniref:Drug/metabolite transporter superfamily protein YnfA n=1 Tax=Labrys wisconsinensis TaxID=425677 RepID=A0ABU0J1D5_9HYPH|nr:DUF2628 domain-containing protein [Labrys wisconsinensis]MDQ0467386.1 drug/metabolite transporter superfamily protein YnfA [Labrys wisconsinensis]
MASWSVFEPPASPPGSFEAADASAFVKDGWCWPALLIPPVWLLWRRMWLVFLGWLGALVAINLAGRLAQAPDAVTGGIEILFFLWFALEANALRRWTLAGKDWRFVGIATGSDRVEAEHRFFASRSTPPVVPAEPTATPGLSGRDAEPVLGVFPHPWGGGR